MNTLVPLETTGDENDDLTRLIDDVGELLDFDESFPPDSVQETLLESPFETNISLIGSVDEFTNESLLTFSP